MNFTREPILETIIAAKEGYKLKLKSTKHEGAAEYLVDAVEVVSFGTTFFYRSGEPAHTFFVPAQDFEIVQVRQARLQLKTPTDKAVKIAGGADGNKKAEKPKKKKAAKEPKKVEEKKEEKAVEEKGEEKKVEAEEKVEKKATKSKSAKKSTEKKSTEKKAATKEKKAQKNAKKAEEKKDEKQQEVQPSMFSHLLRPPEALISDNLHKYQEIIDAQKEEDTKEKMVNVTEEPAEKNTQELITETSPENKIDDPNLTSEAPKPFEKLEEEQEEKPLSLKEKMKKVLAPALKEPANGDDSATE